MRWHWTHEQSVPQLACAVQLSLLKNPFVSADRVSKLFFCANSRAISRPECILCRAIIRPGCILCASRCGMPCVRMHLHLRCHGDASIC